jgi:hypothetical protein
MRVFQCFSILLLVPINVWASAPRKEPPAGLEAGLKAAVPSIRNHKEWGFSESEVSAMRGGPFWENPRTAPGDIGPLNGMAHVAAELKRRGIELLVVPLPMKTAIYWEEVADPSAGEVTRPDYYPRTLYDSLEGKGVRVLDLWGYLRRERSSAELLYLRYQRSLSPYGSRLVASAIAQKLRSLISLPRPKSNPFQREETTFSREPSSLLVDNRSFTEKVLASVVTSRRPEKLPGTYSAASPILLMGDCSLLDYHSVDTDGLTIRNAGIPDHVAYELRSPVDLLARKGGASTVWRDLLREPEKLNGKRAVVWVFSSHALVPAITWVMKPSDGQSVNGE